MSDTVIKVENLTKEYRLGVINHGTLHQDLQSWWARMRGKEDPNSLISSTQDSDSLNDNPHMLALRDVSFDVKQGEILGIIGRNGAGKSTLLKILSRVTAPTSGTVKIKGRVASLLEVGTGFHPELTGRENVYLNGAILGMTKKEINSKFDEIVAFAEIEKFVDTPVKRYSSGMYVRLAFAVAAHLDPEILIVDEVLAVGDVEFQKKCLGKMGDVAKGGRTVLFVSHNMAAIRQLCSKGILLESGKLTAYDDCVKITDMYVSNTFKDESETAQQGFIECEEKEFQLLSVRVLNESGEVTQQFDCDKPIYVELNCVARKSVPGLYGYLGISKKDGTPVLVSDTYDIQPNCLDALAPTNYRMLITVPARSIGHGEYTLNFGFSSTQAQGGFIVDSQHNVCSFRVDDTTTSRGNKRQGYLSTLLKWDISKS